MFLIDTTHERMPMKITEESNFPADEQVKPVAPVPKTEWEKLKAMSLKDRIWYIGEYYKFHIIGAVIFLFLAASIGSAVYQGTFPTVYHCIYMNSSSPLTVNPEPLKQDFASWLELKPKEQIITETVSIPFGETADAVDYGSMAKVSAIIAAKDLDSIIGDRDSLEYYAAMSGCLDLEQILSEETLVRVEDNLVYAKGEDGILRAYGLDLSQTAFAEESGLGLEPPILYIISNSKRIEKSLSLVDYIFDAPSG